MKLALVDCACGHPAEYNVPTDNRRPAIIRWLAKRVCPWCAAGKKHYADIIHKVTK